MKANELEAESVSEAQRNLSSNQQSNRPVSTPVVSGIVTSHRQGC